MKTPRCLPKSFIVPLATALLAAALPLQTQALQMRGFRGVMWGDSPAYLGAAELVAREGDVDCYQRERENLLFGDSELRALRYCFRHDRLFMVILEPASRGPALRAEFERGYGAPNKLQGDIALWDAAGESVVAEITPTALRLQAKE